MRVVFSDRVKELCDLIYDYSLPMGGGVREDAPDEIKEMYKEFKELADKEYEAACPD